jgi:hypothetical protein
MLHSWKEIAGYVGRGVRTIQRYEVELHFPVHRPAGGPRSAVLAFTDEIDRWFAESPVRSGSCDATVSVSDSSAHAQQLLQLQERAKLGIERLSNTQIRVEKMMSQISGLAQRLRRARELREQQLTSTRTLCNMVDASLPRPRVENGMN